MSKTKKYVGVGLLACLIIGMSCKKTIKGYLNEDVFYQVNPFVVQQGVTTVSAPLVMNGSTAPLKVKIAGLFDSLGNNADSILLKPQDIVTYNSTVTYQDTTVDMLKAKLNDSLVRPFNIGEIGGRLQFTAATSYVPAGTYNMDLLVSNIRGSEYLKNACTFIITPLTTTYALGYFSYRYYTDAAQTNLFRTESDPSYSNFDITYEATPGVNQIIFKWVDKNGVAFNPKNGEVTNYSNAPASTNAYPTIHQWAPYYPAENTDTAIIQKLPVVNLAFPYFDLPNYSAVNGVRIDNKVYGMVDHTFVWTVMYFNLYSPGGTYRITYHLLKDTHK